MSGHGSFERPPTQSARPVLGKPLDSNSRSTPGQLASNSSWSNERSLGTSLPLPSTCPPPFALDSLEEGTQTSSFAPLNRHSDLSFLESVLELDGTTSCWKTQGIVLFIRVLFESLHQYTYGLRRSPNHQGFRVLHGFYMYPPRGVYK